MPYLDDFKILHGAVSAEQRAEGVVCAAPCRLILSCVYRGCMFATGMSIRDCKT